MTRTPPPAPEPATAPAVRRRRIHQVLVSASPHDAQLRYATGIRDLLGPVAGSVAARHVHPGVAGDVVRLSRFEPPPGDIILYHAAIGDPDVHAWVLSRAADTVVVHHNLTPPGHFRHDPDLAGRLEAGRAFLRVLAPLVAGSVAVSAYNAEDLRAAGHRRVEVAPLIVDWVTLTELRPHPPTVRHLTEVVRGPVVLAVGQLVPHKRPDLLIEAYHLLVTELVPDAHLILVGPHRHGSYAEAVRRLAADLDLPGLWITGAVPDAVLAAFYRRATVFTTVSEHEGFCAPAVEAMAFGVPVVARARAALPETIGYAGLLLPPDAGPTLVAEAWARVIGDPGLRAGLSERARRRAVEVHHPSRARRALLAALSAALGSAGDTACAAGVRS